jgi:NADH-quinone oxidoreductase subunit M
MFSGILLSLAIWVPIAFGIAVLVVGNDRNPAPTRWTALVGSILGFLVCIPLWTGFQQTADMQFVELAPWIARFNVSYHLGVDGISMPLILLNSLMTVLVVIAHWDVVRDKVGQYLAAFLIMSGLINGVFAALDAAANSLDTDMTEDLRRMIARTELELVVLNDKLAAPRSS